MQGSFSEKKQTDGSSQIPKQTKRKRNDEETFEHYWSALSGLTAKRAFGTQPFGLFYDIIVSNVKIPIVQERVFIESKDRTEEAIKFATSFKQGARKTTQFLKNQRA